MAKNPADEERFQDDLELQLQPAQEIAKKIVDDIKLKKYMVLEYREDYLNSVVTNVRMEMLWFILSLAMNELATANNKSSDEQAVANLSHNILKLLVDRLETQIKVAAGEQ